MKQHISVEQFIELTEEQKNKVRDWWWPHAWDRVVLFAASGEPTIAIITSEFVDKDKYYPILSIGQMLDFIREKLSDKEIFIKISPKADILDFPQKEVKIMCVKTGEKELLNCSYTLVDALWEIVKENL